MPTVYITTCHHFKEVAGLDDQSHSFSFEGYMSSDPNATIGLMETFATKLVINASMNKQSRNLTTTPRPQEYHAQYNNRLLFILDGKV